MRCKTPAVKSKCELVFTGVLARLEKRHNLSKRPPMATSEVDSSRQRERGEQDRRTWAISLLVNGRGEGPTALKD